MIVLDTLRASCKKNPAEPNLATFFSDKIPPAFMVSIKVKKSFFFFIAPIMILIIIISCKPENIKPKNKTSSESPLRGIFIPTLYAQKDVIIIKINETAKLINNSFFSIKIIFAPLHISKFFKLYI